MILEESRRDRAESSRNLPSDFSMLFDGSFFCKNSSKLATSIFLRVCEVV